MTAPKVGDKVKVEYEGVVVSGNNSFSSACGDLLRIRRDDRTVTIYAEYVTVIEPAYEIGVMYQDANSIFYLRGDGFWVFAATGDQREHDFPKRPLTKLVPEA